MWRNNCPKSQEWISSGPTSEADHGFDLHEQNVENMAIEVIRQDRSSNVGGAFSQGLGGWEGGLELP